MTALRVLIIAEDLLVRAGLAALLNEQDSLEVVGQVGFTADLFDPLDLYQPDVLLWDCGWNAQTSLERLSPLLDVLEEAESGFNGPPVVLLFAEEDNAIPALITRLNTAGAGGALLRDTEPDAIAAALFAVTYGLLVLEPALADFVLTENVAPEILADELTAREMEVLQLLAEGLPNKIIAQQLDISDHTVKFHVNAIMSKLNAQSRTEAVVRATRAGLILL
jgi:two-component system nitrate/nitrite response regulator NarL